MWLQLFGKFTPASFACVYPGWHPVEVWRKFWYPPHAGAYLYERWSSKTLPQHPHPVLRCHFWSKVGARTSLVLMIKNQYEFFKQNVHWFSNWLQVSMLKCPTTEWSIKLNPSTPLFKPPNSSNKNVLYGAQRPITQPSQKFCPHRWVEQILWCTILVSPPPLLCAPKPRLKSKLVCHWILFPKPSPPNFGGIGELKSHQSTKM
jgi:hypothetical protein